MSDTTGDALALPTETPALPTETPAPSTNLERAHDGRFVPGSHGNPFGRPLGSKNRCIQEMESIFEGDVGAIGRKIVDLARDGNPTALRLYIERTMPRMRSAPMNFEMPSIKTPADIGPALSAVLDAAACGQLDIDQARGLAAVIETRRKSFETIELEERMGKLEEKHEQEELRRRR